MSSHVFCLSVIVACAVSSLSGEALAQGPKSEPRRQGASKAEDTEKAETHQGTKSQAALDLARRYLRELVDQWERVNGHMRRGGLFMWVILSSLLFALPAALSCLLNIVSSRRRREASWAGAVIALVAILLPAMFGIIGWRIGISELDTVVRAGILKPEESAHVIEMARSGSRLPLFFGLGATGLLSVPWLLLVLVLSGRRQY